MSVGGRGRGPSRRPMPIIGEDRPDVEDTTVEELARRQEEAEAELAARRDTAERELRSRQAVLDRAERRLAQRHGRSSVQRELDLAEQEQRSGIRGSRVAVWAWGLGVALLVLGVISSGPDTDPADREALGTTDEVRVAWLRVAVAADEAWALTASGEDLTLDSGRPGDTVSLAEEASDIEGGIPLHQQVMTASFEGMTAEPGSSAATAAWTEVHTLSLGVVRQDAVADLFHESIRPDRLAVGLLALGGAGLVVTLVVALRRRAGWQAAAAGGAVVLTLVTLVQVDAQTAPSYADAAAEHRAAQVELTDITTGLHEEVSALLDGPQTDPSAALDLAREGSERFEEVATQVADERDDMLGALAQQQSASAPVAAAGLGAAALAGAAFALPGRRKDR
ncbi:hypothetical protein [Serinicoccus hydrothermalis]|nr:hypothetical protein [Serinicoccus hydrothermalis]